VADNLHTQQADSLSDIKEGLEFANNFPEEERFH